METKGCPPEMGRERGPGAEKRVWDEGSVSTGLALQGWGPVEREVAHIGVVPAEVRWGDRDR